jgi:hypothetical protein
MNLLLNENDTKLFDWVNNTIGLFSVLIYVSTEPIRLVFQVLNDADYDTDSCLFYSQTHIGGLTNEKYLKIISTHSIITENINKTIITQSSDNINIEEYIHYFAIEVYKTLLPYYNTHKKIICELLNYPCKFIINETINCCPNLQNIQLLINEIPQVLQNLCIGVYPNNSLYNDLRFIYNKLWNYFPHAIYYPKNTNDISFLIQQFVKNNLEFAIRCGGHSYEPSSLSTGYIVDVKKLPRKISVNKDRKNITVSSGFKLGELANRLAKEKLIIVTGESACVGLSGISLMGGKGPLSRLYGTMSENIIGVKMINYKGELITTDETQNSDLFWAIKGAGNGNFGIITEFTINVYEDIYFYQTEYEWQWNKEEALKIIKVYQKWVLQVADNIYSKLTIIYNNGTVNINLIIIKYSRSPLTEDAIFSKLFNSTITKISGYYIDNLNNFISCANNTRPFSKIKSAMIFEPIKSICLSLLVNSIETQLEKGYNILYELNFTQLGGQIKKGKGCYFPKNAESVLSYFIEWTNPIQSTELINFLNDLYIKTEQYISFYCFPNLIDYDIIDYMTKYYGDNKDRLIKIKSKYDPNDVFHSRQGIPVYKD